MLSGWLLAALVGCAGPGFTGGGPQQVAGGPSPEQMAAMQNGGPAPQQASWTQKVTNVFTGNKANQPIGPGVPKTKQPDPLALSFQSGPPNAEFYFAMAKMGDQGGNAAYARSMYHKALGMEPTNLEGMLALARLEDREGQLDAALHYYLQAVKLHPTSGKAHNDLALCFARRGQLNEAVAPLEQAIRLQPTKQLYRNNIAKILAEQNRFDQATKHLMAVHPPAVAQYNMGVLLHERGRDQEAVGFLVAATQADPTLTSAQTLLAELSGGAPKLAQAAATFTNNQVLQTQATATSQAYPTTPVGRMPDYQAVPAETAQLPMGHSPVLLPPVRQ